MTMVADPTGVPDNVLSPSALADTRTSSPPSVSDGVEILVLL